MDIDDGDVGGRGFAPRPWRSAADASDLSDSSSSDADDDPGSSPAAPSGNKVVYFVWHAEALHNAKEKEAVQASVAAGKSSKAETEAARKAVLAENRSP